MQKFAFLLILAFPFTHGSICWKDAYSRGVGKVNTFLTQGQDKDCNPCSEGYYKWTFYCVYHCPPGFRDDGLTCFKPPSYGRGAGYPAWMENKCREENPETGCEMWGALWYPKCRTGYHNFECCVCSPDCLEGMLD